MAWSVSGIGVGDKLALGGLGCSLLPRSTCPTQPHPCPGGARGLTLSGGGRWHCPRVRRPSHCLKGEPAAEVRAFSTCRPLCCKTRAHRRDHRAHSCRAVQRRVGLIRQFERWPTSSTPSTTLPKRAQGRRAAVVERILKSMQVCRPLGAWPSRVGAGRRPALDSRGRDIAPADMLLLRQHQFAGFATDSGSPTSHTPSWPEAWAARGGGPRSLHGWCPGRRVVLDAAMGVVMAAWMPTCGATMQTSRRSTAGARAAQAAQDD